MSIVASMWLNCMSPIHHDICTWSVIYLSLPVLRVKRILWSIMEFVFVVLGNDAYWNVKWLNFTYPSSSFIVMDIHFAASFGRCTAFIPIPRCARVCAALWFLKIAAIICLILQIEHFRIQNFMVDFCLHMRIKWKNTESWWFIYPFRDESIFNLELSLSMGKINQNPHENLRHECLALREKKITRFSGSQPFCSTHWRRAFEIEIANNELFFYRRLLAVHACHFHSIWCSKFPWWFSPEAPANVPFWIRANCFRCAAMERASWHYSFHFVVGVCLHRSSVEQKWRRAVNVCAHFHEYQWIAAKI